MATLTYVYAEQTAVLGPLATFAEPHTYDLCAFHAERLTAPQGWDLVRLSTHFEEAPDHDDLLAVAEAVRERRGAGASPPLPGLDDIDGLDGLDDAHGANDGDDAHEYDYGYGYGGGDSRGHRGHGNGTDGPAPRVAHLRVLRDERS